MWSKTLSENRQFITKLWAAPFAELKQQIVSLFQEGGIVPEFLIILMIWLGLLDPTVTYTVSQVQTIATDNSTWIEQTSPTVDTTLASWQTARELQRGINIVDPSQQ